VENYNLEAIEVARKAVEAASGKQSSDIVLLDARSVCSFADYFVICAGDTERQIRAIYDEIEHSLKREGILPHHHEGTIGSGWLLLDYGDIIVHIFNAAEREYYRLDELWSESKPVLRIQ
jgi:ribosome-associated protein